MGSELVSLPSQKRTRQHHSLGLYMLFGERENLAAKDRAFAIYGILKGLGVTPTPRITASLLVVYTKTFFTDLLRWKPFYINLLVDVGHPPPDTPSRVPDRCTIERRSWLKSSIVYNALERSKDSESSPDRLKIGISDHKDNPFRYPDKQCNILFRTGRGR